MKLALRSLVFGATLSICAAGSSSAQYMKLISDNPTDPTRMRPSGTTVLTITLDTNHDKDGSPQTCNSHLTALGCGVGATGQPLTVFSYTITLTAVGGTVSWGAWNTSNATTSPGYSELGSPLPTSTQVEVDFFSLLANDPPGLYTLGSVPVTVVSGNPRIEIARGAQPINPFGGTWFGTNCDANIQANSYTLGDPSDLCHTGDWFDADGVNAASGNPGTLSVIANMSVFAGSTADQIFTATDPDGDAISFSSTGPAFLTLVPNDQVGTTRTGTVHLAPPVGTGGIFAASVTAASGGSINTRSFTILVRGSSAPVLTQPNDMTVYQGGTADQQLTATDTDGDPLTFSLVDAPYFVTVTTTNPGTGTATGNIHVVQGDFWGATGATVRVSDGISSDTKHLQISVINHSPALTQPSNMTVDAGATADQPLIATDPDGVPLSFTLLDNTPAFATVTTVDPGHGTATGNLHVAPTATDQSATARVGVSDNFLLDVGLVTITVTGAPPPPPPPPPPPVIDPIPTLTVAEGDSLNFMVIARDPGGQQLSFSFTGPSFMTLTPISSCSEQHENLHLAPPIGTAGSYSASVSATAGSRTATQSFTIQVNTATQPPRAQSATYGANVYLTGDNQIIRLGTRTAWCAELEPAQSSFQVTDVVSSSLTAAYGNARAHAVETKTTKGGGKDGALRLAGFFGKEDLRQIFAGLPDGKQTVDMLIGGNLISGGSFKATVSVPVEKGAQAFGKASPNPFNPSTAISFELNKSGRVRLRIYDVTGRLINTLADRMMGVGFQEARWDGTARNGSRVASGVYFYILETPERTVKRALVVAK